MTQQRFPHYQLSSKTLDWFQAFPINKEAQDQTQFPTPLGIQVLNFIKPFLQNFYPGKAIHTSITQQQSNCNNFNDLLQNMILQKPQFLLDIIYQNTSNTLSYNPNISSELLLFTFKNILSNFTTVLFTSLNYKKIFHSHYFLPPHSTSQRAHIAINLA
ncbi:45785_t:CDS:1, partial [Gigaspora margarita]